MSKVVSHIPLDPSKVKKILVCQLRQIGDVMLSTPVAELLAKKYPDAEIHFVTEKKCVPVLENNPYIHKIWAIDKSKLSNIFKEFSFYWTVARQGYDLFVGLQHLPRVRWISYFCDAPVKIGTRSRFINDIGYTHLVDMVFGYASESKALLLKPLGIEWDGTPPKIFPTPEERLSMDARLQALGVTAEHTLITVDATHFDDSRKYPTARYAEVISRAAKERPDLRFVLLAGPGEEGIFEDIRSRCMTPEALVIPQPSFQLREVAACQERAALHFGNCSAPRHMAVAAGIPTFVMIGSSSDAWRFPSEAHKTMRSDIDCSGLSNFDAGVKRLASFEPETVAKELLAHLEATGK